MNPDEFAKLQRGECPNDDDHVFVGGGPVCQCGLVDSRNDPPPQTCPTCGGSGEVPVMPKQTEQDKPLTGYEIRKGTGDVLKDLAYAQRHMDTFIDVGLERRLNLEIAFVERALRLAINEITQLRANKKANAYADLVAALKLAERFCPCGARPESPNTHPHAAGCLIAAALAKAEG